MIDARPPRAPLIAIAAAATALLAIGLRLRLDLLPWHLNVWGVDWLAYYEPQARDLRSLWLPGWALSWEGLHPPLSGMVHGAGMALETSQWVHWGATLAASLLAPLVLGLAAARRTSAAALLLLLGFAATSPLQANYGLNTSPYPWALLLVACSSAALARALDGDDLEAWLWAGVLSCLTAQVHVLAFAAVGAQALFVLLSLRSGARRPRLAWAALVGLSCGFVVAGSLLRTGDPWTFHIGEGEDPWVRQVGHILRSRFVPEAGSGVLAGWMGLGVVAGLVAGPRRLTLLLLAQAAAWLAALALFYSMHVADPRLTHYFSVPQLLLAAAAACGYASLGVRWGRIGAVAVLIGATALALPWTGSARTWHRDKAAAAAAAVDASAGEQVRAFYVDAGPGDVIAYLWGYRFLNDEPEHLDPVAARWPVERLGRPCFDLEEPRHRCNQDDGARFWFAPSDFSGDMESQEEELRIMINGAEAPGRALLVVSPGESAPPHPWPMEAWLDEHGAEALPPLAGGVLLFRFPPGARIPDPPPMHPGEPPPEDPEPDGGDPEGP